MNAAALLDAFRTGGPEGVVEFVLWLAESYGLPEQPHVLDIGCGTGRLLGPFAALGWRVTGMEPDPDFLDRARAAVTGLANAVALRGGFGDVEAMQAFDLVMAIDGPFAYLLTGRDRADALARCHRALTAGGVLLLDVPNFLWILKNYRAPVPQVGVHDGREVTLHRTHEIDYHHAVFRTVDEYVIADPAAGTQTLTRSHAYAMTTFPEIAHLLAVAGFEAVRSYGSYDARHEESIGEGGRMLVSARKPERPAAHSMRPV